MCFKTRYNLFLRPSTHIGSPKKQIIVRHFTLLRDNRMQLGPCPGMSIQAICCLWDNKFTEYEVNKIKKKYKKCKACQLGGITDQCYYIHSVSHNHLWIYGCRPDEPQRLPTFSHARKKKNPLVCYHVLSNYLIIM